jgi:hypothetical protein
MEDRKNYISIFVKILVGSKHNSIRVVFRNRKISRGNTKSLYGYIDDFISCLEELVLQKSLKCSKGSSYLNVIRLILG